MTWNDYIKQCGTRFIRCRTQADFNTLLAEIDNELERDPPPISKEAFWSKVRNEYYEQPRSFTDESIAGTALGNLLKTVQAVLAQRAGVK